MCHCGAKCLGVEGDLDGIRLLGGERLCWFAGKSNLQAWTGIVQPQWTKRSVPSVSGEFETLYHRLTRHVGPVVGVGGVCAIF